MNSHTTAPIESEAPASGGAFLLQPRTVVRILWVAVRLLAVFLLTNQVDPFFYEGF